MSKVVVPVEKLPPPDENGNHIVRFRIITDDRNVTSQWSTLYKIKSLGQWRPQVVYPNVTFEYEQETAISFKLVWDTPTEYNTGTGATPITHNHSQNYKQHSTDIFIMWNNSGEYEFHDRVLIDSTTILIPENLLGSWTNISVFGIVSVHGIDRHLNENSKYTQTFIEDTLLPLKIFEVSIAQTIS